MRPSVIVPLVLGFGCGKGYSSDYDTAADYADSGDVQGDTGAAPTDDADTEGVGEEVDTSTRSNPWVDTTKDATSTFSVDVDSGSYSLARREILAGRLPSPDVLRVEEFVNYFHYDGARPDDGAPFAVELQTAPSRFGDAPDIALLRIGIQAEEIPVEERDPVNLVFLVDVSGSMQSADKLGLVKYSLKQLVDRLAPTDTLGIVVYAGADGVVLEPTPVEDKSVILDALDAMQAGGGTNGEAGIRGAYDLAESAFRSDGVNRVVLCSDGDMNIGLTGDALVDLVESFRDRDIFLTTLGFGTGNYDDHQMEQLADHGNGSYAYIDSRNEAVRVLGENLVSTLQVVAKDTKVQVEFDPATVERWRLIGYENRLLEDEQFEDDTVDAGDIGAGHAVTGLYELDLVDAPEGKLADVRLRYKEPTSDTSELLEYTANAEDRYASFDDAPDRFRLAAGVAEFAEILRGTNHSTGSRFGDVYTTVDEATAGALSDPSTFELLDLVDRASRL